MSGRTDWLTYIAKPIADDLADRMGSLKRVLSAGIMALNDMTPDQREYYMAKSVGKDEPKSESSDADLDDEIRAFARQFAVLTRKLQNRSPASVQKKSRRKNVSG